MNILIDNFHLQTSLSITYQGKIETIDRLVIDTGAAQSLLSSEAVEFISHLLINCPLPS